MIIRTACVAAVAAGLVAGAASAHHSRALYDMTSEVVIEGTLSDLDWKNPHITMTVETAGPDGEPVRHEIEALSVSEAQVLGLRREALSAGSHIIVHAHPGRRGPGAKTFGLTVTTNDGVVLPLNTDARIAVAPEAVTPASSLAGRWAPSVEAFYAAVAASIQWPLTDAARAAAADARTTPQALLGICADFPPPALSIFPDLREIEVGDATVVMRFEAQGQNQERVIHLDESAHPADVAPSVPGHSIGRWEGESLVIDTAAFAPHSIGITSGVSSGPAKHLVERLTLTEDRLHLRYDMTLEDPAGLTGPATFSMLWDYRPDLEPSGLACDPEAARRALEE